MRGLGLLVSVGAVLAAGSVRAAVSTYTIPAHTTYVLQSPDPHIGTETVVNVEAGALLDMDTLSAAFAGITGAGVVSNGTATLSLAGGPHAFSGRFHGTLAFAQGATPDAQFGLVIGASDTLAGATVQEPATTVHPLRFAPGISPFVCGTLVCADGPTLALENEDKLPCKLVTGLDGADNLSVKGKGTLHVAAGAGNTVTLKNGVLSGLKGQIGVVSGTLKLDSSLDISSLGGYYVQADATLCFRDGEAREVLDVPLSSDGDGIVYFRRPMELRNAMVRLRQLFCQNNCTNIVLKDSILTAGTVYNTKGVTWHSTTNEVEISGFGGLRSGWFRSYLKWYEVTDLGYTTGHFWNKSASLGYNYIGMSNQAKMAMTLRDGGCYGVNNVVPAASLTVLPGGHLMVGNNIQGTSRVLIDGGYLDLVMGDHYAGFKAANGDGNFPIHVGTRGANVRGYGLSGTSSEYRNTMTFNNRFLAAGGAGFADGGVRFSGYLSKLQYPIGFNGPLRADGALYFDQAIVGHCSGDETPDVANDVVIGNAAIASGYTARDLKLATGTGKKVVLDGSATFRANGSQAYVLGPTGAAAGAAVQRNRGSALFFLRKGTTALDGSDAQLKVNGGLANDTVAGIVKGPCFTVRSHAAKDAGTRVDFARYDSAKGLVAFADYVDNVDAGENTVAWIHGGNVTMTSTEARVRGLAVDSYGNTWSGSVFEIPAGSVLHVGNGTDPACVILNGSGNSRSAEINGSGTLDFGPSEGVVVCHRTLSYNYLGTIATKISGSNGLSVVAPCDMQSWSSPAGVSLSNSNNDYTGDTYVNGAKLEVRANGALSTGDVYVGRGIDQSGSLLFAGDCSEVTNALHLSGWGCLCTESYAAPTLQFNRNATVSGPVEIANTVRFGYSDKTGTVSGVVSGAGELQLWNGRFRLQGRNTYTGGTLIAANSKIWLEGDDVGFGTGLVIMDPGEIDLCGTRHTIAALCGTGRILNTDSRRATLTLEKGMDLAAGEISGKIKVVVKGGCLRIGADVTLGENVSFEIEPGASIDWCGAARPVRYVSGDGCVLDGTYAESHPKGGVLIILR